MKKIMYIAVVSALMFTIASPLTAEPKFGTSEWTGSQEQKRFDDTIASNTDKQNEGLLQLTLGMVCVSGGMIAVVMPLVSMGDAGDSMPIMIGIAAGGVALTILGIWQLTEAFPKMASIPGLPGSRLVYAPVIMQSSNSLAHCLGVSTAF